LSGSIPFIDAAAVEQATPMPALMAAIENAFSNSGIKASERLSAEVDDDRRLLIMPAWGGTSELGVKVIAIDARRRPSIQSTYIVIDQELGLPRAVLDGAALTRRRTAAASVLAASKLARRSNALLLLGTGALIESLIEAYASTFDLQSIAIWGRDFRKAEAIASRSLENRYRATAVERIDEQLANSDIVSAATMAARPLIAGALLTAGAHVDLIGAYTPEMCEADAETFARSAIFVDTLPGARSEAGDLIQAIDSGMVGWKDVCGDLASLCTGQFRIPPGKDLTLFKSVGTAIEDLAAARLVLEAHGA
jgi:ornithine cyclodeaminase/alanine dehydrogenase-like protein (mu-crystallin family)